VFAAERVITFTPSGAKRQPRVACQFEKTINGVTGPVNDQCGHLHPLQYRPL